MNQYGWTFNMKKHNVSLKTNGDQGYKLSYGEFGIVIELSYSIQKVFYEVVYFYDKGSEDFFSRILPLPISQLENYRFSYCLYILL